MAYVGMHRAERRWRDWWAEWVALARDLPLSWLVRWTSR